MKTGTNNNIKVLKEFSTKELVEELKQREGVKATAVDPYVTYNLTILGAAVVLIVED